MRKPFIAVVLGALVAGLIAAPVVTAKQGPKGPKDVPGAVTVTATPSTVNASTTTVAVSGNVKATSSCRKDRTVRFSYIGPSGTTAQAVTAVTRSNGDFDAVLPKPADTAPATVTLQVDVDATDRKVGSKKKGKRSKKGRKINCQSAQGQATLTVVP